MDRGLVHKSSPLVGEMGEAGHGWWSVNNLRPPFEQQHHPSLFMPSTTTTATATATATAAPSSSTSPLHSFSSLLLSNHYPLPTTSTSPWHHDSSSTSSHAQQGGLGQQDSWSQLIQVGLATNGEERYKEGQMLFPVCSEAGGSGGGSYLYSAATASHGSSTSDEIQLPWGSSVNQQHHKALQQKAASSPRSSSITSTTSLGSNMLEFSNNNSSSSPRESISTASGSAFKKARTQEPSPAQSTVKVRKEKLGDRITALHQLVSPFGKTDTASVLLEAIGYIRFLHGQIEALSSPYVGGSNGGGGPGSSISSSSKPHQQQLHLHEASVHGERHSIFPEDPGQLLHDSALKKRGQPEQDGSCDEEAKKDLRSRGLCLVPVSCTLDVGVVDVVAGPADYWAAAAAPAFGMGFGG